MRHSLYLLTVTYICMGELPHFHHGPTTSFLHSQPIQTPPSGPRLICTAGQVFIWDDPSVAPLSCAITKGVPLLYPQCGRPTSILFWGGKCFCWIKKAVSGWKPVVGRALESPPSMSSNLVRNSKRRHISPSTRGHRTGRVACLSNLTWDSLDHDFQM